MSRYPKRHKLAVLAVSMAVGICAFAASYYAKSSEMTEWQRKQNVDVFAQKGTTKLKAQLDSASIGGAAFCGTAIILMLALKLSRKK